MQNLLSIGPVVEDAARARLLGEAVRNRGSSPKLQVLNTALMTAQSGLTLKEARAGRSVTAIEVQSGRTRDVHPGLAAFAEAFKPKRKLLVGGDGIAIEKFLSQPVEHWTRG